MPERQRVSRTAVEAAYRGVKRACYAGHDSITLRKKILRRSRTVLPHEAFALGVTDPDTGLLTHALGDGLTDGGIGDFLARVYPHDEAIRFQDLAREGEPVAALDADAPGGPGRYHSRAFAEWLKDEGMKAELRAAFATGDQLWGQICLMRETRRTVYTAQERDFVRSIAPHVARGLRAAALLDTVEQQGSGETAGKPTLPGVLVIDSGGRILHRNATAAEHLDDLRTAGSLTSGGYPAAVSMLIGRLYARHQGPGAASDHAPLDVAVRTRGNSGTWYRLQASLSEPGEAGNASVIVVIEPLARADLAPLLARLYGLTPREREVVALVARGQSTRQIARRLDLSPYTVQDHVDHACDKIGVRGRKRLVARLFFDGYAPLLRG